MAGGQPPFGYRNGKETYAIEIYEPEAEIIREIFDLYVRKNYGTTKITNHLNREAKYTRNGHLWRH
ncbi:recombinase family protein [Alicyclobacillus suci]|uniref:recombinase family protein n=1 Tax=Alicyclobacillus suci TaxID=2816080 RepID=UPI001A8E9710